MTEASRDIPYNMFNDFTMNGQVTIEYKYANDCSEEIQHLMNANFTKETFSQYLKLVSIYLDDSLNFHH